VPQDTPGFTRSKKYKKMGWRASDTRELAFADATVPEENLLGERGKGLKQFLTILDGGRISVAALSVGVAMGAYDEALRYAQERRQFGKPISKFQAIQFKLADMLMEIEHAKLMVLKAAWEKDHGRAFELTASLAKLYSGEVSRRVVNEALQIHGGYGFMDEYPISRMYRDQKINEIGEGTNEVQRLVIARQIGL
jgi:butyryl-CoA dehydrogenase